MRRSPVVPAKTLLLGALLTKGEGYGLELAERVKATTKGRSVVGQGRLYITLREMEREGLVTSREGPPLPERGNRPRRYYKLTEQGTAKANEIKEALLNSALDSVSGRWGMT